MNVQSDRERLSSSFRDPSGYIYFENGTLYRQIESSYMPTYRHLMDSGLYQELVSKELLIPHQEVSGSALKPERLREISYPYEWCFGQLQDAALATLEIQLVALSYGMTLKDASSYNIQFWNGKPVLIDTLSFEMYEKGTPWKPYGQFCQHFLAPLALMRLTDMRLAKLLRLYIDGIPLDLVSKMLPFKTRLNPLLAMHLHFHAKNQSQNSTDVRSAKKHFSPTMLHGLIDSLQSAIRALKWKPQKTTWGEYYTETNYTEQAMADKKRLVGLFADEIQPAPQRVWDLGANTGEMSKILADRGSLVTALDLDTDAVQQHYERLKDSGEAKVLPLVQDLTNPSPDLGWAHSERDSLIKRGPVDLVLALALVHHLAIGNNLPFGHIAKFFAELTDWLIVEWVPKEDSQIQKMLSSREDIFQEYDEGHFVDALRSHFELLRREPIAESKRVLFLFKKVSM